MSENCARIICLDISSHIAKKYLILSCFKDIQSLLEFFTKTISKAYIEKSKISKEAITVFNRMLQHFKGAMCIQSHFAGIIELRNENFDVNAEIINMIELLYLKSCSRNVSIVYTREKGIPNTLLGERSLHNVIIFNLLDYTIENSIEGSDILILVQVSVRFYIDCS